MYVHDTDKEIDIHTHSHIYTKVYIYGRILYMQVWHWYLNWWFFQISFCQKTLLQQQPLQLGLFGKYILSIYRACCPIRIFTLGLQRLTRSIYCQSSREKPYCCRRHLQKRSDSISSLQIVAEGRDDALNLHIHTNIPTKHILCRFLSFESFHWFFWRTAGRDYVAIISGASRSQCTCVVCGSKSRKSITHAGDWHGPGTALVGVQSRPWDIKDGLGSLQLPVSTIQTYTSICTKLCVWRPGRSSSSLYAALAAAARAAAHTCIGHPPTAGQQAVDRAVGHHTQYVQDRLHRAGPHNSEIQVSPMYPQALESCHAKYRGPARKCLRH